MKAMIDIPCQIQLPQIWEPNANFTKNAWGDLNFLVGPNGSGKTLFAEQLKQRCSAVTGLLPRYVSAERLVGLERENTPWGRYTNPFHLGWDIGRSDEIKSRGNESGYIADAFLILREKLDIRIRVEAILSTLFGRRIRFAEEGGFLRPMITRITGGGEYSLRESECHGLKEILSLLAMIYDDQNNCLIIDEPELHLHPQFQTFLVGEVRRYAGNPLENTGKKCFFLITHSPYVLDIRSIEELRDCLVFREGKPPVDFGPGNAGEEAFLKRFLPRLNTHHKQFFFSARPIFVEGYTDQQLFTLIEHARGKMLGANGASFIDVGGKSEQEFFFRLTRRFEIESQVISDLDVLIEGRLRDAVSENVLCQQYVTTNGVGTSLNDAIAQLVPKLDAIVAAVTASAGPVLESLRSYLAAPADTHKKRYATLVEIVNHGQRLRVELPGSTSDITFVEGKVGQLRNACSCAGMHLHANGELENNLPFYKGDSFAITDIAKQQTFERERDFILNPASKEEVEARYPLLVGLLDAAVGRADVDLKSHVSFAIAEFIGKMQLAFAKGELTNIDSFQSSSTVRWSDYSRVLQVVSFDPDAEAKAFSCRIRLSFPELTQEFDISDQTAHAKFRLT